ncbi:ABC transporter permease subunit [Neobacillus sp. OS1-2]|uniref:ABC transporter permease subunit n=1 Tax=Neobacillus sp. OS1-2 TaxID=3070680 RepID=UPI0027E1E114|nr:ABC transporter permease subunit [Neobacillus sp. OS1-2]WML40019.1 ABC transporter permease subunit [Neobacillus sp. OS1-2]
MKIVKKIGSLILQCFIGVEVLILIAAFPVLFANISFHFTEYFHAIYELNSKVFTLGDFLTGDGKSSLFPFIIESYFESMKILGLGIVAAFFTAFLITYLSFMLFRKRMKVIKYVLELAESVPDLMFILLLQMAVILIYQKTGIKLAQVVSVREKAVLLPIISISIPISFYITKILIHHIEEELEKSYISLAVAKGLSFPHILNLHVLRNIADGMFGASKTIFWSMLSTLLVIDYLFNMNGLLRVMGTGRDPFIIGCLMIFVPFFILYRLYEWISFDNRKDQG